MEVGSPQFYGIVAGCVVYVVTVVAVLVLLFKSGSISRMIDEIKQGKPTSKAGQKLMPQRATLFDELIAARGSLPRKPGLPKMDGKFIALVPLERRDQFAQLFSVSDGSAIFDFGKYDPMRIWGFFPEGPFADSDAMMSSDLFSVEPGNVQHFGILDNTTNRLVGSVSLRNNEPQHLSIEIDTLWITPALQGKTERRAREAVYLLCKALFDLKYRRVQVTVDVFNTVGRKFFERLGFQQDGLLRKHRIVRLANQDSVVYSLTNSNWFGQAAGGYARPVKQAVEKMIYGKVLPEPKSDDEAEQPAQLSDPAQPAERTTKPKSQAKRQPKAISEGTSTPATTTTKQQQQSKPKQATVSAANAQLAAAGGISDADADADVDADAADSDEDADELVEYAFYQSGFIATQGFSNLLNNRQPRLAPSVNKSRSTTDLAGLHTSSMIETTMTMTSRSRLPSAINAPLTINEVTDDDMDDAGGEWLDASAMNARLRRRQLNSKDA